MSYIHLITAKRVKIETCPDLSRARDVRTVHGAFPEGTRRTGALGVAFYFTDPYSSWLHGSNENANDLLREFFPKGLDFATVR